ncbi:non-ribosomal peptide synthetase, partial [Nostocoides japonicum]|uniref:non-ribosomal peptide synthetase n=1 Tax=Nostocoides japonicum TaxID=99481 RepID=UPI00065B6BC5
MADPVGAEWLPLTPAQQGLFFAHQLDPGNPAYTTAEVVELEGPVDAARLDRATVAAYEEFEQLRATFALTPDGPRQRVHPTAGAARVLTVVDVPDAASAAAWLDTELARPLDITGGEVTRTGLLRSTDDGCLWWWHAAHHVVLDGYGAVQLLRRIAERYADAPPSDPVPLRDLVAENLRHPESEAFWDARMRGMSGPVSLAGRLATPAGRARRRVCDLDAEFQSALDRGARRLGTTWADLVTAAAGSYVARFLGVPSARIGLPLMNRMLPGVGRLLAARTVCTAMNVLPAAIPATGTVGETLAATRAEQRELRTHPFERQEWLARRLHRHGGVDLFGTQVNIVPFDIELALGDATGVVRNLTAGPVEDLTLTLRGSPGRGRRARLELDGHPDLYDDATLDLHLARLRHWLSVWAGADPDEPVGRLPLLPATERELVTRGFNETRVQRSSATLGRRFLDQALRTPDAAALRFGGTTRTYAELLARARTIATGLRDKGIGPGDAVGVQLERGIGLYETIHAVALLGAAYLPLDPDLPDARIAAMVEDAGAVFVVTDPELLAAGGTAPDALLDGGGDVDAPAYILFTSGSTGRPKGVVVSHRAIDNRLAWMQHHLALREGEVVLHKTPISFDVSVWELYWPLQVGGCVAVAEPGAHRDPRALATQLVEDDVAVVHFVPSMLRAFLTDPTACATMGRVHRLRSVVTSGEALTPELVAGSQQVFGVLPTNLYGPTEAAVDVTAWDCTPADGREGHSVPIGRPVWNTSCLVLGPDGEPVPIGAAGELWLGGVQLAEGYAGRPDLTADRFVGSAWGRLYRTGDLAAWRPDGAIRYLGRTDDQVKIRGQRIELGEVEAVLAGVGGVRGVCAGVVDGRLVVWFVPPSPTGDGASVAGPGPDVVGDAKAALVAAARSSLPASWLPSHWVAVPSIPVGSSGKADRRRLSETAVPSPEAGPDEALPRGLLQQRIAGHLADILGADAVPADADFFTLGGDSLSALRLVARLEEDFGRAEEPTGSTAAGDGPTGLPPGFGLADVFAHPTAEGLAAVVADGRSEGAGDFAEVLTLRAGSGRDRARRAGRHGRPTGLAPLVVLPPAGGLGWCYTGLLADLSPDLPVHTIQAPGIGVGRPEPVADLA